MAETRLSAAVSLLGVTGDLGDWGDLGDFGEPASSTPSP